MGTPSSWVGTSVKTTPALLKCMQILGVQNIQKREQCMRLQIEFDHAGEQHALYVMPDGARMCGSPEIGGVSGRSGLRPSSVNIAE